MSVLELKRRIIESAEEFVDELVLGRHARHVTDEQVKHVADALAARFGAKVAVEEICVVGSAKIGYSLFNKKTKSGDVLPAFRAYRPESDIDIAVVSPFIFDLIWDDLASYAIRQARMPWNSDLLGDYLVYGWIRPDHFPKNVRLRRCDDWWDLFRALSADLRFGRRVVRGALYRSREQLRKYQLRGAEMCKASLETNQ